MHNDDEKILTVEEIAKMSKEDILKKLLFKSWFKTDFGPPCQCQTDRLNRFLGMLPDELCEKSLEEVEVGDMESFETEVSSLCPCGQPHFFKLKKSDGDIFFEDCEGRIMDSRKLKLPNFRDY